MLGMGKESVRRTKRFTSPTLKVIIDGVPYNTADWSLGGVSVANYTGDLNRKQTVKILLGETAYSKLFAIPCSVVRRSAQSGMGSVLALKFEEGLSPDVKVDLHGFLREMAAKAPMESRR